jgi:L-threonylcarbamoyladenylate synthase
MVALNDDIKNCVTTLQNGGTILYPTDTVWGLGCDATNAAAIDKIFAIKERPKEKSLIILVAEAKDILQFVAAPPPDIIAILESFEKPTTVIYNQALDLPDNAIHENGSIAIRVTQDPFCKAIIKQLQKPIVSTSANKSGMPTPAVFSMIDECLIREVDYVAQHRRNDNTLHEPSSIIMLNDEGAITRIR